MSKKSMINSEHVEEKHTLGGRIAMLREEAGYTTAELSRIIGVKEMTFTNWEQDRSEPRINKLVALSGILGVSPAFLMAELGKRKIKQPLSRSALQKKIQNMSMEIDHLSELMKSASKSLRKLKSDIKIL
jgi:transcriptional regulator with XRE-family HTH domain